VPVEDATGDEGRHRGHLVERKADAVHLDVVGEAVDADLREVNPWRTVDAERHPEFDRSRVEGIEVRVIEIAGHERGRDVGRHQPEVLRLPHDVDRHRAVLDRRHGDPPQPAVRGTAVIGDPLVVEPRESGGELGILQRGSAQTEAGIQHHRVDPIPVGVAEYARRSSAVDAVGRAQPVLGRATGARTTEFGIVAALDHQAAGVGTGGDALGPAPHRLDRKRRPLGDVSVRIDDAHPHLADCCQTAAGSHDS